ncbi:hypothetical protein B0H11DRAFT_2258536 [Mycena galericulata]|nr:hypothetical protein B0H11DRAFT_2258536 [Mycena galericulata]
MVTTSEIDFTQFGVPSTSTISVDPWDADAHGAKPRRLRDVKSCRIRQRRSCLVQRNNAHLIPDGTITSVSFLKTDFDVQIMGTCDFTKLNSALGDKGGEIDPNGATGLGNTIGGNFCICACTNVNSTYSVAFWCWNELERIGCEFVMPGTYKPKPALLSNLRFAFAHPRERASFPLNGTKLNTKRPSAPCGHARPRALPEHLPLRRTIHVSNTPSRDFRRQRDARRERTSGSAAEVASAT